MIVSIEITANHQGDEPEVEALKKALKGNINALDRYIDGKPLSNDDMSLIDTKYILIAIKDGL